MSKKSNIPFYAGNRCGKHRSRNIDWNFLRQPLFRNKLGIH